MKRIFYLTKVILAASAVFVVGVCALYYQRDIPVSELKAKYADAESKFVDVGGMQVHYRDEGVRDDPVPIVLLHGIGANLRVWDGWVDALKAKRRIVRVDLPGFGLTGPNPSGNYSMEEYARFIHEFLRAIGIRKSSVAGNSMGGRIAWEYALAYPAEIEKLVLIDATGFPSSDAAPLPILLASTPVVDKLLLYVTPKYLVENSLRDVYEDDSKVTDEMIDQLYDMTCREGNRGAFIARAKTPDNGHFSKLGEIGTPTLVLWGRQDNWVPVGDAYKFERALPNAKLIVYEGVGHMPMAENPQDTARDALAFL